MNENYIPLYRKYRPQKLEQLVGQEHIKKALSNAINLNKIAHAYLFTGPRGTGKTSSARILAKSLNCKNGPTVEPCGVCESCTDIANSVPIDVIEIDAASNRKVEDAQNILEKIQYVPVNGKFKIYIIDEVHMLTNHAFNALLKTLEEPPENVIFILATTEPHKVLDTIKSRCQRFDFKRITVDDIVEHLKKIAQLEKIKITNDALFAIAKNSAGGMRDSLALLDQLSVLDTSNEITPEDINNLLGRISFDTLDKLADFIANSQPQDAIELLENIYNSGNEPSQILLNLLEYFKNLLIVKNCQDAIISQLTQANDEQIKILKTRCENLETHQIVFLIERISHYIKEVKSTTNQHLWLEIAMIDLANMSENTSLLELQQRIAKLEGSEPVQISHSTYKTPPLPVKKPIMTPAANKVAEDKQISAPQQSEQSATEIEEKTTIEKTDSTTIEDDTQRSTESPAEFSPMPKSESSKSSEPSQIIALWQGLLTNIQSPSIQALLKLANPVKISPEEVIITFKQEIFVKQANDTAKKQIIIDASNMLFNQQNTKVIIRLPMSTDVELKEKPQTPPPVKVVPKTNPTNESESDEKIEEHEEELQEIKTKNEVKKDNFAVSDQTKMVMELFDGKYID